MISWIIRSVFSPLLWLLPNNILSRLPFSACHSEAEPKNLGLISVVAFWKEFQEVDLSVGDDREQISRYLIKNKGSNFVAYDGKRLVGAVLAGDDGRRGYLYHLAVHAEYQRQGIGSNLLTHAIQALAKRGIRKCHVFVFPQNEASKHFLAKHGFQSTNNFIVFSKEVEGRAEQ